MGDQKIFLHHFLKEILLNIEVIKFSLSLFCVFQSLNAAKVRSPFEEHMTGTPWLQPPAASTGDPCSASREGSAFSPILLCYKLGGRKPLGPSLNSSAHP